MTKQILLDNTLVGWSEFADGLVRFRRMVQTDAAFAYVVTAPGLRDQTTALCRYLDIEDYTYVLGPGEQAPAKIGRASMQALFESPIS